MRYKYKENRELIDHNTYIIVHLYFVITPQFTILDLIDSLPYTPFIYGKQNILIQNESGKTGSTINPVTNRIKENLKIDIETRQKL